MQAAGQYTSIAASAIVIGAEVWSPDCDFSGFEQAVTAACA